MDSIDLRCGCERRRVSRTDNSDPQFRFRVTALRTSVVRRHPPSASHRSLVVLLAIGFVLLCVPGAHGAPRKAEFNVDFFCGWDGYYRPMEWTPVEIQIGSDLKEPFSGSFTASARQDGLNTLNVTHNFVLTPDVPLVLPLATKFAFGADRCDLAIRDERGRVWWRNPINLWDPSIRTRLLRVVQEEDLLIGVLGQPQFGLLRLSQETASTSDRGPGKVCLGAKVTRASPWDWTGFASLDLLVLYDPDWTLFRPQQMNAIRAWVWNGGTALLILGQHPLPAEGPLSDLVPFRTGEPRQMALPAEALAQWSLDASGSANVTAWPLFPKPQARLTAKVAAPETGYLYGMGYAGFGRMAVLAFNPSQLGEEQARHASAFWVAQITACCKERRTQPDAPNPAAGGRGIALVKDSSQSDNVPGGFNDNRYRISAAQNASNQVMEHLYQLRQMKPLSIWWVILTLSALAVLLGPVDYLVLKRLDKLPYTWLTSTGWIVIFTVGAYYGVQWIRGGDMELRVVSVLDGVADSNCAWATCYTGLFAPRSDDYRLADLKPNQWWSGITPNQEELYSFRAEPAMRQIYCAQGDGGNLPVSVPVNIWTVQTLLSEWALDRMPFTAKVERRGATAIVEIRNDSDSAIRGGFVLFADTCADLGAVPARTTQRFEAPTRPFLSWQDYSANVYRRSRGQSMGATYNTSIPRYPTSLGGAADNAFFAQGCLSRTLAMHGGLAYGAALVCVVFEDAPVPLSVKDCSYQTNHIQLARQLVWNAPRDAGPVTPIPDGEASAPAGAARTPEQTP